MILYLTCQIMDKKKKIHIKLSRNMYIEKTCLKILKLKETIWVFMWVLNIDDLIHKNWILISNINRLLYNIVYLYWIHYVYGLASIHFIFSVSDQHLMRNEILNIIKINVDSYNIQKHNSSLIPGVYTWQCLLNLLWIYCADCKDVRVHQVISESAFCSTHS